MVNEDGLHRVWGSESRRVVTTKHVCFDEGQFSYSREPNGSSAVDTQQDESADALSAENVLTLSLKGIVDDATGSEEANVDVSYGN